MTKALPHTAGMVEPLAIYQTMLDFVSDAVLRGDVAQYLAAISLPYTIHTESRRFDLVGTDDLVATLLCTSRAFRRQGVTDYLRLGRTATYVTRRQIVGTHYTHIMRGDERIAPPYLASQTLVSDGSAWRFSAARYAIANNSLPFTFPQAGADPHRLPFHPPGLVRHG